MKQYRIYYITAYDYEDYDDVEAANEEMAMAVFNSFGYQGIVGTRCVCLEGDEG